MSAEQPTQEHNADHSAPTARPRQDQVTGRNRASEFAATLLAQYNITKSANNTLWPVYFHYLSVTALGTMFYNMIKPLVYSNHRALGAQTIANVNDLAMLDAIIQTVTWNALNALYCVLYNKALHFGPTPIPLFGVTPQVYTLTLPSYVTAVINAFGPIKLNAIPFRGNHIPVLIHRELVAARPNVYNVNLYQRFLEALNRSRTFALADVNPMALNSEPFWCFHPRPITPDPTVSDNDEGFQLFSNVEFEACDPALKVAALFAKTRLTQGPGPIHYSATPYYDVQNRPELRNFPAEAKTYPYFVGYHPAYYTMVEDYDARTDEERSPTYRPMGSPRPGPSNSRSQEVEQITEPATKKRKLPDGSSTQDATIMHRLVYHYFDHINVISVGDIQLEDWATEFGRAT